MHYDRVKKALAGLCLIGVFTGVAVFVATESLAQEMKKIAVSALEHILKKNPLQPGGPTAKVVGAERAGNSELQILVMSKVKLHHHTMEDRIVYIARGHGIARLGGETRDVKVGDIIDIPRGVKHGFEKKSVEDLVLLVVATAGWKPLEDTKFHE